MDSRASSISERDIFIYFCSAQLISFEIKSNFKTTDHSLYCDIMFTIGLQDMSTTCLDVFGGTMIGYE